MGQKESRKERWLIVPLLLSCQLSFCQQRIHERWKVSVPLAQIPLCSHKCRNSSKITKKQELFLSSWPQESSEQEGKNIFFWKRWGMQWCTEVSVVDWCECVCISTYKCVHLYLSMWARKCRQSWLGISASSDCAGDEREWRWRCGCRCLNLYLRVSRCSVEGPLRPYYGWLQRAQRSLKNISAAEPALCQLRWSEETYASLSKKKRKKILMKVHIDAIN